MAARIPAGAVECRDAKLCGGARFHYVDTNAACGATKTTVRSAPLLSAVPPRQKADPNCPIHGIEPEGELVDASAALKFNRQSVAAGVMAGAVMLGACSCSSNPGPDPDISPTTSVEQTVEPTPDVSPTGEPWEEPSADPDTPEASKYPALDAEGYEFSDEPQSEGEQWIFDNYPELWDQGIRAVSDTETTWAYNMEDKQPAALVQYINGKRYEGTESVPLGFRGQLDDPESYPTDAYPRAISGLKDPSQTPRELGNSGEGGFVVNILEDATAQRNQPGSGITSDNDTVLSISQPFSGQVGQEKTFASWEEAWSWLQENNFQMEGMDRPLNKGEVAAVTVMDTEEKGDGSRGKVSFMVYNPETGKFVTAATGNE